ncbi:hypothetical protein SAMN04487943_10795 [Gracilibacillus orientalis]|uniref:Uncharacterized protein n=1 Tax=Gracilibacillus orientalis TaxID=334253 RepID=A0A1I4MUV5_9BACI|nr:hypothetical protein [Gracilibacillus orientalis]SFM06783.1 hypothetical protein SAMN04487943_10795 [Gracilibacillus orientalis]
MKAKQIASKVGSYFKTSDEPIVITAKIKKKGIIRRKGGCCLK